MTPRIHVLSPDATGARDGTVQAGLLDHLPNQVGSVLEADVIVVPISFLATYKFNEALHGLKKPYVLIDFLEFGWDAGDKNNILGSGMTQQFGHLNNSEYAKLDQWVWDHPPRLTFKRELFKRDVSPTMLPVEFPCQMEIPLIQSKEEFDKRPLDIFFPWGFSHPSRPRLHGDIFRNAHVGAYTFVDHWDDLGHVVGNLWASIHTPWMRRHPISEVMRWNQRAKISVSLWGAGKKCFRHTMEAPVGSIMALPSDNLAWSFEWDHGMNCIRLDEKHEIDSLMNATTRQDLYEIYKNGQCTVARYCSRRYVDEYIMTEIQRVL